MKPIKIMFFTGLAGIMVLIASCSGDSSSAPEEPVDQNVNDGVVFTDVQLKRAGIHFGKISPQLLSRDIHARGKVVVLPDGQADVSVLMEGVIREINAGLGKEVKKGELLATCSNPEFITLQQQYLGSKSRVELLRKNYERMLSLREGSVKSQREMDEASNALKLAETELAAKKAQLALINIDPETTEEDGIRELLEIRAPISGVITEVNIRLGMYVGAGEPLFRIINPEKLAIRLKVFEKDIPFVKAGQRVTYRPGSLKGRKYEGEVSVVGGMLNEEEQVIPVMVKIKEQPDQLIPGTFISAEIHTSEDMLMALPETALLSEGENLATGFYTTDDTVSGEISFYRFSAVTGFHEDGYVQVDLLDSIPENAWIAVSGVYYLKSKWLQERGD